MSETYEFPDAEDIPQIRATADEPFEKPETKNLFISYDEEKWPSDGSLEESIELINQLFGQNVQVACVPQSLEFLGKQEIEELLQTLSDE